MVSSPQQSGQSEEIRSRGGVGDDDVLARQLHFTRIVKLASNGTPEYGIADGAAEIEREVVETEVGARSGRVRGEGDEVGDADGGGGGAGERCVVRAGILQIPLERDVSIKLYMTGHGLGDAYVVEFEGGISLFHCRPSKCPCCSLRSEFNGYDQVRCIVPRMESSRQTGTITI